MTVNPHPQHTCWCLGLPLALTGNTIYTFPCLWTHDHNTCTHRISKSTSNRLSNTSLTSAHTNSSHGPGVKPRPLPHPSIQHCLIDRTGIGSGLVCKAWSTSYLFIEYTPPLLSPRPLCCPPLFPISFSLITYTRREDRSECRLNPHGDKNTEYVEGARKRDVFQSQRSVLVVLPWRGRLAVKQSLAQWAGDSGILMVMMCWLDERFYLVQFCDDTFPFR